MIRQTKKVNLPPQSCFHVLPDQIDVPTSQGETFLDALLKAGIAIDHSCGGMGSCGTCMVKIVTGLEKMDCRNELEQEIARDRKFSAEERLSCQNRSQCGLVLKRPI